MYKFFTLSQILNEKVHYHSMIGPICCIRAITMMLYDYKYSRPSHTVSPTPILTALAGTQELFLYITVNKQHKTDIMIRHFS